ncbi:unnamed protein product [Vitrella brassicaformis CCMP3155]|uniref:Uncharacterized protein n=1 Tax=Vitrella brassicaformis (strain CCMP3155) TaxID=1169540 RepID=A0A0G4EY11_VITBC|nr:unnamed protein product [Vitrella brassicaformis CCMP3155]|eukprot:CEM04217.1 unnamed protein product [Vitrella brassicaformis CCMP3155]
MTAKGRSVTKRRGRGRTGRGRTGRGRTAAVWRKVSTKSLSEVSTRDDASANLSPDSTPTGMCIRQGTAAGGFPLLERADAANDTNEKQTRRPPR